MKTILITGDRGWTDTKIIQFALSRISQQYNFNDIIVVHGAAKGADTIADIEAKKLYFTTISVPANWEFYGKRAGVFRNHKMFDTWKPDIILAFHNNIQKSKGTKEMIKYALSKGHKNIFLFTNSNSPVKISDNIIFHRLKS